MRPRLTPGPVQPRCERPPAGSRSLPCGALRLGRALLVGACAVTAAVADGAAQARSAADSVLARSARPEEPGVAAVVVRDGAVVYRGAVGRASLEQGVALSPSTILDIGSVAKQFTAWAIVRLEAEGRLSLDDDIRRHLPELPDLGRTITIRHLLNHTSGLREIYNTMMIGGWQGGDAMRQEHALRVVAAQPRLQFEPGSEHLYNNTGYMLLSDIVERVTGAEFHDWMAEHVFRPLGMTHTVIMHELGQVIPGSGDSYAPAADGRFVRVFDNSTVQGAGGIYSTADDVARWVIAWAAPSADVQPLVQRMQERAVLTNGDTIAYALGVMVGTHRGLRRIQHSGSSAGYRAFLAVYPDVAGGVIVQSNHAGTNAGAIASELAALFFADRMTPVATTTLEPTPADSVTPYPRTHAQLVEYEGRYYSGEVEAVYHAAVRGDTLFLRNNRVGEVALRAVARDRFAAPGALGSIEFLRDDTGRLTGFSAGAGRTRDVRFVRLQ